VPPFSEFVYPKNETKIEFVEYNYTGDPLEWALDEIGFFK